MIDESILKSNFLGRDGFRWWIGQIPPTSAQGEQANGGGWGNRCKVRILGYHPYSETELPNEDLPWAQVLIPTTAGTGAANYATNTKLQQGDVVFGFFLDGDNAQIPVIIGCFGRTDQVGSGDYNVPFAPFTGYSDNIKKPSGTLKAEESNQQNAGSQKSPRSVPPSVAAKLSQQSPTKEEEISYYGGIGQKIVFSNTCEDTSIKGIVSEVTNLLSKVQNVTSVFLNLPNEIARSVEKITGLANGIVGQMFYKLFNGLVQPLQQGLDLLYKAVFAKVLAATGSAAAAHAAGVVAQESMVGPVKVLEQTIPCVASNIVNGLSGVVRDILNSVIDNVKNFVSCAGEQFVGSFANVIVQSITAGLSSAIGGVSKILQFVGGFDIDSFLRNGIDTLAGIGGLFNCNQSRSKCSGSVNEWTIGSNANDTGNEQDKFTKILNSMNVAAAISQGADSLSGWDIFNDGTTVADTPISALGGCYTGDPGACGPPQINIFGGGGSGAFAIPILGSFSRSIPNIGGSATPEISASVIGVRLDNSGSGYRYPPFVEIFDNCNQGYGALARSVINDRGEVTAIYLVSEGENYPIGPQDLGTDLDVAIASAGDNNNYVIERVVIEDPGFGYNPNDRAIDNLGNNYQLRVSDGLIIAAFPLNSNIITSLPDITVISEEGRGAVLRPIVGIASTTPQGEVVQVIDCIT
jgi:hypothetical protein